ncbi:hypothetical protein PghCCS26_50820 [Paenibacillus glycanilyticus]|uniref:TauD/TfdA-like domain-containing protein n=1 Tax=Paenibacillus glycanilyticus TaxID=126569 RepID=A0ABQ6NS60_9BACL|nr:TauD/TfdA family dioxygenase [Paenibacillus glycanilyticus]GMK47952.1 hypothetical protein PghCCS26_50820 [Paenibacillus glycanilyticus]
MSIAYDMQGLLVENKIVLAKYNHNCIKPTIIEDVNQLDEYIINEIIDNYLSNGFAVFEIVENDVSDEQLLKLYAQVGLKDPFVPSIYKDRSGIYENSGLNYIAANSYSNDIMHRAFQTNNRQELHSDGTLEDIGVIATSTLFCVEPADIGGETIIFNSVGAFYRMLLEEFDVVESLLNECALKRIDLGRTNRVAIGPAFKIIDNKILSRFSMDNTCNWEYGIEIDSKLSIALNEILKYAHEDSPYYTKFKLGKNQGVIMANSKVSHGRESFQNGPINKRKMVRGLFSCELLYASNFL